MYTTNIISKLYTSVAKDYAAVAGSCGKTSKLPRETTQLSLDVAWHTVT
jgi:hypothetical protein